MSGKNNEDKGKRSTHRMLRKFDRDMKKSYSTTVINSDEIDAPKIDIKKADFAKEIGRFVYDLKCDVFIIELSFDGRKEIIKYEPPKFITFANVFYNRDTGKKSSTRCSKSDHWIKIYNEVLALTKGANHWAIIFKDGQQVINTDKQTCHFEPNEKHKDSNRV